MELKTIELTKKFGSKTAVNHLNITLTNGVYGLLGANGAGKTTFMRLLCNNRPGGGGRGLYQAGGYRPDSRLPGQPLRRELDRQKGLIWKT